VRDDELRAEWMVQRSLDVLRNISVLSDADACWFQRTWLASVKKISGPIT
jgi:hypothetical protein